MLKKIINELKKLFSFNLPRRLPLSLNRVIELQCLAFLFSYAIIKCLHSNVIEVVVCLDFKAGLGTERAAHDIASNLKKIHKFIIKLKKRNFPSRLGHLTNEI